MLNNILTMTENNIHRIAYLQKRIKILQEDGILTNKRFTTICNELDENVITRTEAFIFLNIINTRMNDIVNELNTIKKQMNTLFLELQN